MRTAGFSGRGASPGRPWPGPSLGPVLGSAFREVLTAAQRGDEQAFSRLFRDAHACNAHVMFSPEIQGAIFGQHALASPGPPPLL